MNLQNVYDFLLFYPFDDLTDEQLNLLTNAYKSVKKLLKEVGSDLEIDPDKEPKEETFPNL
jgi:hypothetical protein